MFSYEVPPGLQSLYFDFRMIAGIVAIAAIAALVSSIKSLRSLTIMIITITEIDSDSIPMISGIRWGRW